MTVLRRLGQALLAFMITILAMILVLVGWAQVSPPGVMLINLLFRLGAVGKTEQAPPVVPGVSTRSDLAYGTDPIERLDVHRPTATTKPLPVIVWVHGGGWIGGDKADVGPYLQLIAAEGYVAVAINYSLAPDHTYPTPVRQTGAALDWVVAHAKEIGADPDRIVLAGDSAGAQIAAQHAAMITDREYAAEVGIEPTIGPDQLVATILHSGPYDPPAALDATGFGGWFVRTVGRAYLGSNDLGSPQVQQSSVVTHVSRTFPPTLLTGGDLDPLTKQGRAFATRLTELGVENQPYWYADLNHEFQFDLSLPQSQEVLAATTTFLGAQT